ncbi:MAG: hypothetical protein ABIR15_04160 [Chitinophagaceae bacterium]
MKTKTISSTTEQLNNCLNVRQDAADQLQNEVNQILAAALLWIRFAKMENKLTAGESIYNAEINLKEAIERVRALHYFLTGECDSFS